MPLRDRSLSFKISILLLLVSMASYVISLTMNVAEVHADVRLDDNGISKEIGAQLAANMPVDAVSEQISGVVKDLIKERFPMVANRKTFDLVENTVRKKVRERGPSLISGMIPQMKIPQPPTQVTDVKLLQTIRDLIRDNDHFLATCIFLFTIFFPISKYVALSWLIIAKTSSAHRYILSWLKSWGQWSMGDVFVAAFLVVFLKINTSVVSASRLADIQVRVSVEIGLYFFAASVVLAMIVSMLLGRDPLIAESVAVSSPTPAAENPSSSANAAPSKGRSKSKHKG